MPLSEDISQFFDDVVRKHGEIGINLPDPDQNIGYFVTFDKNTRMVRDQLQWKQVTVNTKSKRTGKIMVDKFTTLDEDHIRAAIQMVMKNRGLA